MRGIIHGHQFVLILDRSSPPNFHAFLLTSSCVRTNPKLRMDRLSASAASKFCVISTRGEVHGTDEAAGPDAPGEISNDAKLTVSPKRNPLP